MHPFCQQNPEYSCTIGCSSTSTAELRRFHLEAICLSHPVDQFTTVINTVLECFIHYLLLLFSKAMLCMHACSFTLHTW